MAESSYSQLKRTPLHPFIQWEIKTIAWIDSFQRPSNEGIAKIESGLMDSIANLRIERRSDVQLELAAIDTLMSSDFSNAALAHWEYSVMDDLLNNVYGLVMNASSIAEKTALRSDERKWLKKKAAYFKQIEREHEKNGEGTMFEQVASEQGADYVRKRVMYLANKIKS
ncbi:MAG: lysozyme inhibitor LprI family protein [Candidatus Kapaibacterium sp.]